jgi:hypothetical protein
MKSFFFYTFFHAQPQTFLFIFCFPFLLFLLLLRQICSAVISSVCLSFLFFSFFNYLATGWFLASDEHASCPIHVSGLILSYHVFAAFSLKTQFS